MKINLRVVSLLILLLYGSHGKSNDSKTFRSATGHFTFTCPAAWQLLEDSRKTFEIINFPKSEMLKGIGLSKRGASIIVVRAPDNITSIEDWLAKEATHFDTKHQHVIDPSHLSRSSCKRLTKVEWDSEVGSNTFTHQTSLYCQTEGQLFRIELSNWSDDPQEKQLQGALLGIATTFKSW